VSFIPKKLCCFAGHWWFYIYCACAEMSIGTFLTTGKCMRHSETIGWSGELREWRHKVKAITDVQVSVYGNGCNCQPDSCSNSSGEEHAICFGALSVLQQMDDEEKGKLTKQKRWCVRPWIARRRQFGEFYDLMKEIKSGGPQRQRHGICKLFPDGRTAISIYFRRCFAVDIHKAKAQQCAK